MKEDIFLWGQFREHKQTYGLLLEAITYAELMDNYIDKYVIAV